MVIQYDNLYSGLKSICLNSTCEPFSGIVYNDVWGILKDDDEFYK